MHALRRHTEVSFSHCLNFDNILIVLESCIYIHVVYDVIVEVLKPSDFVTSYLAL